MEIDLVAYTQDSAKGEFLYTLCAVRRFVGYLRHDTDKELEILKGFYQV